MNKPRLLVLNTIGLTGVELLLTELARSREVIALPGQNFSMFGHNLYRAHDYSRHSADAVFDSLARLLYTREGRIWMGLTKHMTEADLKAYPVARHKELFMARLGASRDYLDGLEAYITTFFHSIGNELNGARYLTYYSNNVLLNYRHYPRFAERTTVVHVSCRIARWLTIISQTRTWDCAEACKFWLVSTLFAHHYGRKHGNFLAVNSDDIADRPDSVLPGVYQFLSVAQPARDAPRITGGFIAPNEKWIAAQRETAIEMRQIYCDYCFFQLADTFEDWAPEFLTRARTQELLDKFARFWNSTSHTNFDWIGPVGNELMDELIEFAPRRNGRNLNFTFYHEYFTLNSDSYDQPIARLEHFLGCLEDEIIIPKLPYYLKLAMEYLISASKNNIKLRHSYVPLREASVYRRLVQPEFQAKIIQFGLADKMKEMERYLTEAETACTSSS
jgi:hypothetical protein